MEKERGEEGMGKHTNKQEEDVDWSHDLVE